MKPRIKKVGLVFQKYACEGRGVTGFGYTPRQAYLDWRIARQQRKLAGFSILRMKRSMTPKQFKRFFPLEKHNAVAGEMSKW